MLKPQSEVSRHSSQKQTKVSAKTKVDTGAIHKISLKINSKKEKQVQEIQTDAHDLASLPAENFSSDQFVFEWKKLASTYKETSLALYMAMTSHKPVITQDGNIQLTLENAIQSDLIQEKKPEILSVIRQKLKNFQINIETRIATKKRTEKAYLPTEKLQKLIKKNPTVEKLQKSLGLDLEY